MIVKVQRPLIMLGAARGADWLIYNEDRSYQIMVGQPSDDLVELIGDRYKIFVEITSWGPPLIFREVPDQGW